MGTAFNVLSRQFLSGVTITLCKVSETVDEFETVLEIEDNRFFEYSKFRKNFLLEVADDSAPLTAAMIEATHVKVDDDYYVIREGDTVPPKSTDPTWKIYCDLFDTGGQYGGPRG